MKIMITIMSALTVFIGLIPFFGEKFFIPNSGTGYSVILIILGILLVVLGIINQMMMGFERFMIIAEGCIIAFIGVKYFLPAFLTFLPITLPLYALLVVIVGAAFFLYGIFGMA